VCVFFSLSVCFLKKWIPTIKDQWVVVKTNVEPHVQSVTKKSIEVYETSKSAVTPHVVRVQELVDPYFQVYIVFHGILLVYLFEQESENVFYG
jgi:hypothetical protein